MPKVKKEYECCRCGYTTNRKADMDKHLNRLLKVCSALSNDIELTEEIKDIILSRCRYQIPITPAVPTEIIDKEKGRNVIFNNYGVLNNHVVQMETTEKLNSTLLYNGQTQQDYESTLETCFEQNIKRLEDRSFRSAYVMDKINLLDCFNKATMAGGDVAKFSFFHDKKTDKIKMYRCGKWETYIPEIGLLVLIGLMKSYFFNDYEMYLIRNLHDPASKVNRFILREHLEIYYQFLGFFNEKPAIGNQCDNDVLGFQIKENRDDWLNETYSKVYQEIVEKIKTTEKNSIRTRLLRIIVSNTNQNIIELNNTLMDILKIDPDYRQKMVDNFKLITTSNK